MTTADWGLLLALATQAVAVLAALLRLVAWGASVHARITARLEMLETKVDNDIAGRKIVAEMCADIAAIKATLVEVKEHVRTLEVRAFSGSEDR